MAEDAGKRARNVALGRKATIERLKQGNIIHAIPTGRGDRSFYFWEESKPSISVRSDTAIKLMTDGLVRRVPENIWATCYELVPSEKLLKMKEATDDG